MTNLRELKAKLAGQPIITYRILKTKTDIIEGQSFLKAEWHGTKPIKADGEINKIVALEKKFGKATTAPRPCSAYFQTTDINKAYRKKEELEEDQDKLKSCGTLNDQEWWSFEVSEYANSLDQRAQEKEMTELTEAAEDFLKEMTDAKSDPDYKVVQYPSDQLTAKWKAEEEAYQRAKQLCEISGRSMPIESNKTFDRDDDPTAEPATPTAKYDKIKAAIMEAGKRNEMNKTFDYPFEGDMVGLADAVDDPNMRF